MKKRKLLGIAAAAMTLAAGCSMMPMASADVTSDVNVTSDGNGGCRIAMMPDIRAHGSPALVWNVKPASQYEFDAANGIKFVKKPDLDPIPAGEFKRTNSSGSTWIIQDRNKIRGKYGYEVHVRVKSSGKTCMLDPTVYNDGSCSMDC